VQNGRAALTAERARIIRAIREWAQAKERYADLHSRARTATAHQLIARVCDDLEEREQRSHKRVYKRRAKSVAKFFEAVERFVVTCCVRRLARTHPSASITPLGNPASTRTLSGTMCSLECSRD
jgi:hypothetical protein